MNILCANLRKPSANVVNIFTMKYLFLLLASAGFSMLAFQSCNQQVKREPEKIIRISGSESEISLMNELIKKFNSEMDSSVHFKISGGGSGVGIKNLLNGQADIALSSRPVDSFEVMNGKEYRRLSQFIIARDVVAIICNSSCGISVLSFDELKSVFEGKIKNWSELGGSKLPIHVVGRNSSSGTYHYIKNRLNITQFVENIQEVHDNEELLRVIQNTKGALGYVNLGTLNTHKDEDYQYITPVKTFIEGGEPHSPYERDAVLSGDYPLVRPLFNYINANSYENNSKFIDFMLSKKVQSHLVSLGYLPINTLHETINAKYLSNSNKSLNENF